MLVLDLVTASIPRLNLSPRKIRADAKWVRQHVEWAKEKKVRGHGKNEQRTGDNMLTTKFCSTPANGSCSRNF